MRPHPRTIRRTETDTAWNRLDDTLVIIALRAEREIMLRLNASAAFLWDQCAAPTTPAALVTSLCAAYDVTPMQAMHDVQAFIERMHANQLIELG